MTKETKVMAIAALIIGINIGVIGYNLLGTDNTPCPEVDTSQIDSLSASVLLHSMREQQALDTADHYAKLLDSLRSNPFTIVKYRTHVQRTLEAAGLPAVLDTLAAPASPDWRLSR